jgi:hypothetical protein
MIFLGKDRVTECCGDLGGRKINSQGRALSGLASVKNMTEKWSSYLLATIAFVVASVPCAALAQTSQSPLQSAFERAINGSSFSVADPYADQMSKIGYQRDLAALESSGGIQQNLNPTFGVSPLATPSVPAQSTIPGSSSVSASTSSSVH